MITALSLWPLPTLPDVPGSDKTHHFIAYCALTLPVALHFPKRWTAIIPSVVLYSGAIELIQPYVNRYGEWMDLAANAVGAVIGLGLAKTILWLFPSINHR